MKFKLLLIVQCLLLLSSCATLTQHAPRQYTDKESRYCATFFNNLEQTISTAGVIDSQAARIKSYPYLRVNRFLSDFRNDDMTIASFNSWVDRMQELANEGWQIELSNLPVIQRKALVLQTTNANKNLKETIQNCANVLRAIDLDEDHEYQHLKTVAKVADEYKTWQRILGLYPLTALAFRSGIDAWHEETKNNYTQALENLIIKGKLIRYSASSNNHLLSPETVSGIIKTASQNTLNIPDLSKSKQQKLFDNFSPVFEIDTVSNDDQIGSVEWDKNMTPVINTDSATTYQHISYTRIADQILLQLNYSIWFPARPETSTYDLLGGHLDGITWRVTLLPNGKPLLYDSIHNCGCYHLFFPTQQAKLLPQTPSLDEPVFIPQSLLSTTERPIVRIASGNHYIERVYFNNNVSSNVKSYQLADYNDLRSIELESGERRNLFGQDGIIQSSKRGERYLFWPMGIPNPGAMRQWAHHATAFVGRRHFDDARLFEQYFTIQ